MHRVFSLEFGQDEGVGWCVPHVYAKSGGWPRGLVAFRSIYCGAGDGGGGVIECEARKRLEKAASEGARKRKANYEGGGVGGRRKGAEKLFRVLRGEKADMWEPFGG